MICRRTKILWTENGEINCDHVLIQSFCIGGGAEALYSTCYNDISKLI